ncbi:MAG: DUF333 domain-containing protein [Candidatus Woesearchaeota archaeon]
MKKALILLCGLALLLLVGCVCRTNADCVPAYPKVGVKYACIQGRCVEQPMGNPASEFCLQNGGEIDIRETAMGQYGVCVFPDGSECEEWAFYRGECLPGESLKQATPEEPPKIEWMRCAQYNVPGKLCTTEYAPVCAKIEMTSGTRWITFQNACLACKASQRPATTISYIPGPCPAQ